MKKDRGGACYRDPECGSSTSDNARKPPRVASSKDAPFSLSFSDSGGSSSSHSPTSLSPSSSPPSCSPSISSYAEPSYPGFPGQPSTSPVRYEPEPSAYDMDSKELLAHSTATSVMGNTPGTFAYPTAPSHTDFQSVHHQRALSFAPPKRLRVYVAIGGDFGTYWYVFSWRRERLSCVEA